MKLPSRNILSWATELIDECLVSRESRVSAAKNWRKVYETGIVDPNTGCKHNKCFNQIDKLASQLFSPADVKFAITFDDDDIEDWEGVCDVASRHLNRQFAMSGCDVAFAHGVDVGLQEGSSFVKLTWRNNSYEPHVVRQQFMGVLREDIEDLDRQEAFVHSYYLTPSEFNRLTQNHPDRAEIRARAQATLQSGSEDGLRDTYLADIIIGGMQPIGLNQPTGAQGAAIIRPNFTPVLAPEILDRLIRVDDLWVWDDDRADWTTIRYVAPDLIIEGRYQHRNLSDIPGEQPFVKVCPNETVGYFWGRPELATVAQLQDLLNRRVNDIDNIFRMQSKPSRSAIGGSGITSEKMVALLTAGGTLIDSDPTLKIDTFRPNMPDNALEYVSIIEGWFDEAAGFTDIMSGRGEPGVRAGAHAAQLTRNSSPRLRDRALIVEKQCAAFGELCLKMSQAKNAKVFTTKGKVKRQFMLSQLPDDATVTVDSHTSSPAFSGDHVNLAFALARAQAIDGESLIEMTKPPNEDQLITRWRKAQAQKQLLIQEHPELLTKGGSHKK